MWTKIIEWIIDIFSSSNHRLYPSISYAAKDYRGIWVDQVISFDEFKSYYLDNGNIRRCHNFDRFSFLYDEGGVYGFNNTLIGFISKEERNKYLTWKAVWGTIEPEYDMKTIKLNCGENIFDYFHTK